ncbi:1-phosphofructokinase [Streptomyces sp. ST2-7A]|uniref:1-phosphofructokinase n=1 Tax=Streptomyces sp. ST2-7A TaxID=2907214 RepID=UPI001F2CD556|nr:1-phosphofructokinase [Streptomyces sp. ST2-7A]MCE7078979.1 1-phosphofructokinase [Streptomyces sp. ST2-7A]
MILTVTPNPSLDRTYGIPALERGAVLRAGTDRVDPGGKGVNVSRAVAAGGRPTTAVLPLGGAEGELLSRLLGGLGVEPVEVPVTGSTRVNISLAEPDGTLTKVNAAGPELSPAESEALLVTVGRYAPRADWTACCGSLPRGPADDWYAELVSRIHHTGARIAVDTSGPAFLAALHGRPDVVKPNLDELAEATGRVAADLATLGAVVEAARELRAAGAGAVLASLGADGQLLVEEDGVHWGTAPVETVRSDVGAGDASLAGFLGAGGRGPDALAAALAHGAAAVQLPGSAMPRPADLRPDAVTVTDDPPRARPLNRPPDPATGPAPARPATSSPANGAV